MDWLEVLNTFVALMITIGAGWFAWETTLMVDEQKKRRNDNRNNDNRDLW